LFYYTDFENELVSLVGPGVKALDIELVEVRYIPGKGSGILRILIDKPGGVTLADCEEVSHTVSDALDVADPISGHYNLEVSSPGINRPLTKKDDFERFAGQKLYIETKMPIDGRRRFKGVLKGLSDSVVKIETEKAVIDIPVELISKARLDIL